MQFLDAFSQTTNPMFAGLLGLWGAGMLTFITKDIPHRFWKWVKQRTLVHVEIHSTERIFFKAVTWFEMKGLASRTRNIRITHSETSFGMGRHFFWYKKRLFIIVRTKDDAKGGDSSYRVREEITISTFSKNQQILRSLIADILRETTRDNTTTIYIWSGSNWTRMREQNKRPFDSIILPQCKRDQISSHIHTFLQSEKWYQNNGIPHRTGLCLYGPPGTGKTSIVKAICAEFNLSLYTISLAAIGDLRFQEAMNEVDPRSVVLIEDIDCFSSAQTRQAPIASQGIPTTDEAEKEPQSLTLSGLLNGIDGIIDSSHRIYIFTSNRIEDLDPALLRPGRIDKCLLIGHLDAETWTSAFKRFYPDYEIPAGTVLRSDITPAVFQSLVLANRFNPDIVLDAITEQGAFRLTSVPTLEQSSLEFG